MPTVYGVPLSPFVRKVCVTLAEKGVTYDLDPVIPFNVSAEFKKLSPLGKIPAYRDGDRTLADSSAICAYIERTHPQPALYPSDPYEYARALWFEEFGDSGLVAIIGPKIFLQRVVNPAFFGQKTDEAMVENAVRNELPPLFDYLEGEVAGATWLVGGKFSIADIGIASPLVNLQHAGVRVDEGRWPKLAAYLGNVLARPSFKALIDAEQAQLPRG